MPLDGKRVLVVDDNPTNLAILERQLKLWKMKPIPVLSSPEAMRLLEQGTQVDLILCDMQMPEIDGFMFGKILKMNYVDIPVILLSSMAIKIPTVHKDLFAAVLTKPCKPADLLKAMQGSFQAIRDQKTFDQKIANLDNEFSTLSPLSILIAEDNPVNLKLATLILNKLGYKPEQATNGLEAVQKVQKHHFDVVLMDVQMPEMDGLEATRAIKKLKERHPFIIAVTANAMTEDKEACLEAGMDGYLSKPFKIEALKEVLKGASAAIQLAKGVV